MIAEPLGTLPLLRVFFSEREDSNLLFVRCVTGIVIVTPYTYRSATKRRSFGFFEAPSAFGPSPAPSHSSRLSDEASILEKTDPFPPEMGVFSIIPLGNDRDIPFRPPLSCSNSSRTKCRSFHSPGSAVGQGVR